MVTFHRVIEYNILRTDKLRCVKRRRAGGNNAIDINYADFTHLASHSDGGSD
jgi:hypothetical protein